MMKDIDLLKNLIKIVNGHINAFQDQSLKRYLNTKLNTIQEEINKLLPDSDPKPFLMHQTSALFGLALAYKDLETRIQKYKITYDKLLDWKKAESKINPYHPLFVEDENCRYREYKVFSFYYPLPEFLEIHYNEENLKEYFQEFIDCVHIFDKVYNQGITNKAENFLEKNKIFYKPNPDYLSDLIIQIKIELENVEHATSQVITDYLDYMFYLHFSFFIGINKNTSDVKRFSSDLIKGALRCIHPKKYDTLMKTIIYEFTQKGMRNDQAKKEAQTRLDSITAFYIEKLTEKIKMYDEIQNNTPINK